MVRLRLRRRGCGLLLGRWLLRPSGIEIREQRWDTGRRAHVLC